MSRNSWIYLIFMVAMFVTLAVVLVILFLPKTEEFETSVMYDKLLESEYKYTETKKDPSKEEAKEEYEVSLSDIKNAQNKNEYIPGNINPFSPKQDVTIYTEPSLLEGNGSTTGGNLGSGAGTGSTSGK